MCSKRPTEPATKRKHARPSSKQSSFHFQEFNNATLLFAEHPMAKVLRHSWPMQNFGDAIYSADQTAKPQTGPAIFLLGRISRFCGRVFLQKSRIFAPPLKPMNG